MARKKYLGLFSVSQCTVLHCIQSNNQEKSIYVKILDGPRESFNSSIIFFEHCFCASLTVVGSSIVKSSIALCILNFILDIAGTFLNTMVLFEFLKSKNMRRKPSYVDITILSATDLTVITSVPVVFLFKKDSGHTALFLQHLV